MLGATHDLEHPSVLCPPFAEAKHVCFLRNIASPVNQRPCALSVTMEGFWVPTCPVGSPSNRRLPAVETFNIIFALNIRKGWVGIFFPLALREFPDLPTLFQGHWVRAVIEFLSHGAQQLSRCGQLPQWILSQCLREDWQQLHGLHQARQQMSEFDAYHRVQKRPWPGSSWCHHGNVATVATVATAKKDPVKVRRNMKSMTNGPRPSRLHEILHDLIGSIPNN